MKDYTIELARPDHLSVLPAVEREAGTLFRDLDLPASVLEDSTSPEDFREAQEDGLLWVALSAAGEPVGFAHVEMLDGEPHLEELDVLPSHGRRGIGRALVERVCAWAREAGFAGITLTTFRDVPWNAPFYAASGFRALAEGELSEELRRLVREEASRGLDPERRFVMRRDLASGER